MIFSKQAQGKVRHKSVGSLEAWTSLGTGGIWGHLKTKVKMEQKNTGESIENPWKKDREGFRDETL